MARVARVPAGTPVRDVADEISPGLAKAALAGVVDGKLVDLTYPARARRRRPHRHRPQPGSAAALSATAPRICWRPPSPTCSRARSAASARRPTKASSTTSSSSVRSCRRISSAIEQKMQELASQDLVYERQMWPRDEAKAFFDEARRAAEGAADRREDRRPDRGLRATRSRTRTPSSTSASARTCRPPAS